MANPWLGSLPMPAILPHIQSTPDSAEFYKEFIE
jgi:hypothetical protein